MATRYTALGKHSGHCTLPDQHHDAGIKIIKEGELLKLGKKTQMMVERYYILRDHSLYIYSNRDMKIPSNIISLRGLYVNALRDDSRNSIYEFSLSHDIKAFKKTIFYHRNHDIV